MDKKEQSIKYTQLMQEAAKADRKYKTIKGILLSHLESHMEDSLLDYTPSEQERLLNVFGELKALEYSLGLKREQANKATEDFLKEMPEA